MSSVNNDMATAAAGFANYLGLMREFHPAIHGLAVFAPNPEPLWVEGLTAPELEAATRALSTVASAERHLVALEDSDWLELVPLVNAAGDVVLQLVFALSGEEGEEPRPFGDCRHLQLLNELLLTEYEQGLALASKEDELNHMTDELTRRYEELNLVYKAEDQAMNIYHGRELLRQLVQNTARFLNVDVIYLYIVGKNIAMHRFRNDNPVFEADKLFACIRAQVQPAVASAGTAIVINNPDEASTRAIDQDLAFKLVSSPVYDGDSKVIGSLTMASQNFAVDFSNSDRNLLDVMARKASKIAQSHFDALTGLENSNSFELILKELLKQTWGSEVTHAIANVDIDRMAVVNDISGREAGDELIRKVGQTLAGMVRSRDVVARIGSDKFGVLLENCDLPTAKIVMKKISHAVSAIDLEWEGRTHEVSVSVGIAPITAQAQSVTGLLNAAETARNVSKERGRNTIHVLDLEDSDLLQRKEQIRWVTQIQSALRDDRFVLYAQPIVPLKPDGDKPHYEILLRMLGDGGEIPPGKFLGAAENFYLMSSIDYWVIDRALQELAQVDQEKGGCRISINLSGQTLVDPVSFAAYIENRFEEHGVTPGDVCFEITESAAIANIDDARIFIEQLRAFGCEFSLDDFGTGLSSFAYLKNLKVNYLKIDGSFVRDILKDPVSESMVAAINQVGHAMQLKTVAEFVENDAIRGKLARIGVDYGQGFGLGKPAPFASLQARSVKSA